MDKAKTYIRFEYDLDYLNYCGEAYRGRGQYTYVSLAAIQQAESPEEAFEEATGIAPEHIVNYRLDQLYDQRQQLVQG